MPSYVLVCEKCGRALEEAIMTVADREAARCPDDTCLGKLTNDYSRMDGMNFQLKGGDWPSKEGRLASKILKERHLD